MVDVTTLVIFVALLWTTLKWPIAQTAYEEHQQRLSSDAWVHDQCQDPTFGARSMQHKELCEHTQALFEQSPWWVAMRTCIPTLLLRINNNNNNRNAAVVITPFQWFVILVLMVLTPSVLLPLYRAHQDKHEQYRLFQACSPLIPMQKRRQVAILC